MENLQVLIQVRTFLNNACTDCQRQEYKVEYIQKNFNSKLDNLTRTVSSTDNRQLKAKQLTLINNVRISKNFRDYTLLHREINNKLMSLPPAEKFRKR